MTIKRTWGARLPRDSLVFYSDKAETRLQQLNVVPLADPNLAPSAVYQAGARGVGVGVASTVLASGWPAVQPGRNAADRKLPRAAAANAR